jgi:6-phosphogluconolactonase (cycloisomerase 2 family)
MVFTMTNATEGNAVQAYSRASDGTLVSLASAPTGGTGVGHGLENQGALTLSGDRQFLYVVNPGSNDMSVFQLTATNMALTDRAPSGGTLPVSVAEWNGIVYVLNRNDSTGPGTGPTIQGFQVSTAGKLSPVTGSTMTLHSTDTNAAQIAISPDGLWIVVTEHGGNQIDVIPLQPNYAPGTPLAESSAGTGPFGFAFIDATRLYVSEAGAGTTSAYDLDSQGNLHTLSAAVPTQHKTTCWLAITPDKALVYVSNTASSSLSSYHIAPDGTLIQLVSVAATTAHPSLDLIVDESGNYLSVLTADGSIETYGIDATSGSLISIQTVSGLPAGTNGLVRR